MKIKSDDRTVADALTGHFLRVPRFQRPYEWTNAEVEDLWDDIHDAGKDYFIGSMVLFPSTHGTLGIVDGQQRVTTITLLLCALRDALRSTGAVDEADGLQNLIERRSVLDNKQHFVLQTDEDNPYLRHVQAGQAGDPPASQPADRLLRLAHGELTRRVHDLARAATGRRADTKLLELRDKVLNLRLILVEVDDEDDATVIFQTLNSRGRDLEAADLVKSHLLSLLRTKNPAHDPAREKWNAILASFAESQADLPMDRFLLHSWLSRREYLARTDLGKKVRKKVRKADADTFLDELVLDSRLYREIHEPGYRSRWQQEELPIQQAFKALQRFRVRQPLPWILAVWREYDAKHLKLKHAMPAIQAIERFHFIATAVANQPSSGGVSKMYASHAQRLLSADISEKKNVLDELWAKLADPSRIPTLDQFTAAFTEIRSSREYTQQRWLALYILQRLHIHAAPMAPDLTQLTVEHLAPQGVSRPAGMSPADVARLGNLILVPRDLNDELKDRPFAPKQEILRAAAKKGIHIDPLVLQAVKWDNKMIEQRGKQLAEQSYTEVWTLQK